jgi:hypothetical protein
MISDSEDVSVSRCVDFTIPWLHKQWEFLDPRKVGDKGGQTLALARHWVDSGKLSVKNNVHLQRNLDCPG